MVAPKMTLLVLGSLQLPTCLFKCAPVARNEHRFLETAHLEVRHTYVGVA